MILSLIMLASPTNRELKILDDVSFTIPQGGMTAIVGPSGGGKTTITRLISRFWDIQGGSITIGGKDVREFTSDSLLKNMSMVFQNVYLFKDTIENNIKFGCPEASHEQVVEAAKKARCHDFISLLPEGYNTMIGEGGSTLSGGEKQRISIARAMLKNGPCRPFGSRPPQALIPKMKCICSRQSAL